MNYEVQHNQADHRFEVELEDGHHAYVSYRYLNDQNSVDFNSTFVPQSHRAKGLAALVVNAAFDWAESQQLEIHSSCWYAEKKLQRRNRESSLAE